VTTIIERADPVLVTGASGFIGLRVVESLLARGFGRVLCLTRPSSDCLKLEAMKERCARIAQIEIIKGNLLSGEVVKPRQE